MNDPLELVAPQRIRLRTTLAGRLVLPLATAGLVAGWLAGGGTSSLFTVSAFALLAGTAFAGWLHVRGLRVGWHGSVVAVVAEPLVARLEVGNVGRCSALDVRVFPGRAGSGRALPGAAFERLESGQRVRLAVATSFHARGRPVAGPLELVSTFPFGLFAAVASFEPPIDAVVLPRRGSLAGLERVVPRLPGRARPVERRRARSGDEHFDRVRELRDGEDSRRVHWGLSARADRWIKRVFVEEGRGGVELVLVTAVQRVGLRRRRDAGFETAVSLVATLARALVVEGVDLTFRTTDGGGAASVHGRRGLRRLGLALAELEHRDAEPWTELAHVEGVRGRRQVFVLAGGGQRGAPPDSAPTGAVVLDVEHAGLAALYRPTRETAVPERSRGGAA